MLRATRRYLSLALACLGWDLETISGHCLQEIDLRYHAGGTNVCGSDRTALLFLFACNVKVRVRTLPAYSCALAAPSNAPTEPFCLICSQIGLSPFSVF